MLILKCNIILGGFFMKKLFSALILCTAMLCGCSARGGGEISETAAPETASVTVTAEISAATVAEMEATTTETTSAAVSEASASETVTEKEQSEYVYAPPPAALDVEFARDNIVCSVDYQYYPNNETAELPEYIFADINSYADEYISNFKYDCSLDRIGVYMFDINSDGLDDYIVIGEIANGGFSLYPYTIERLYIQDGNGGFINVVDFPASGGQGGTLYDNILSTKTNGYNDFMGYYNKSIVLISFDGNSTYSETETLDKDYTWEYLDNDILKIIVYAHSHENDIAVAKPLLDSDYIENMLIYSSLPDGTPSVSVPQTYGSNIFEFYVKRTDKAPEKWNDFWIGPIEVKYIPAQN